LRLQISDSAGIFQRPLVAIARGINARPLPFPMRRPPERPGRMLGAQLGSFRAALRALAVSIIRIVDFASAGFARRVLPGLFRGFRFGLGFGDDEALLANGAAGFLPDLFLALAGFPAMRAHADDHPNCPALVQICFHGRPPIFPIFDFPDFPDFHCAFHDSIIAPPYTKVNKKMVGQPFFFGSQG
jgi:hypothetical protein